MKENEISYRFPFAPFYMKECPFKWLLLQWWKSFFFLSKLHHFTKNIWVHSWHTLISIKLLYYIHFSDNYWKIFYRLFFPILFLKKSVLIAKFSHFSFEILSIYLLLIHFVLYSKKIWYLIALFYFENFKRRFESKSQRHKATSLTVIIPTTLYVVFTFVNSWCNLRFCGKAKVNSVAGKYVWLKGTAVSARALRMHITKDMEENVLFPCNSQLLYLTKLKMNSVY